MQALHLVAVAEVALGAVLLDAPAAGDVPAVLLAAGALTSLLAVALRRVSPVLPPRPPEGGQGVREREPSLV